jgi:hypothetical protein
MGGWREWSLTTKHVAFSKQFRPNGATWVPQTKSSLK